MERGPLLGGPGPVRPELGLVESDLAPPGWGVRSKLEVVIDEPPPALVDSSVSDYCVTAESAPEETRLGDVGP